MSTPYSHGEPYRSTLTVASVANNYIPTIIAMSSVSFAQTPPWDAVDLLKMINPDVDKLVCVGYTITPRLHGRRCRNRIREENIAEAKRILTALPRIANDVRALEHRLGKLASLTLCRQTHLRDPGQHAQAIARWMEAIRLAQSSHQVPLPRTPDQSTRQDLQQRQTNQLCQSSEPSRQTVASALDHCTVCLDHVGTNGGRKTLPCDHTFCRGCIDRWQSESRSCPLCRDNGNERATDTIQPLSQTTGREEDNEQLQEVQQRTTLSRVSRSLDVVAQPSEEVRGLPSVQQQISSVELRADHESSGSQVSHRAAVVSGNTENFSSRRVPIDCGICLEDNGEYGGLKTLRCSHTFCRDCISQWLRHNSRCPYRCGLDRSAETDSETSQSAP
jgi:hypothetical protein